MSYRGPKTSNLDPVINYISNGRAYNSTIGWATYADAAGAQPVDGTGGSPAVTWSRDTTTPLRQGADFNFVKDAVNRQGQGVSYDFTIDNADLAKVLTVTFDYEVVSGTLATGDVTVYLIQDPSGTPLVIQPAGYQVQGATVGTKMRQIATFQTSSTVTSYRLCLHVSSVSATAYTLAVDNVVVGPQVVQYGAPVTDAVSFTPTGTMTTNTTYTGRWRRIGEMMEIEYQLTFTGAPNAVGLSLNLPSGYSIDTSKILNTTGGNFPLGYGTALDTGIGYYGDVLARYGSATSIDVVISDDGASGVQRYPTQTGVTNAVPFSFNSGDFIWMVAKVPILGWSSTVQMSNDTDTRVVAAKAAKTAAQSIPNNSITKVTLSSSIFDTHSGFDFINSRYVIQVPGIYRVSALVAWGNTPAGARSLRVYKNGSVDSELYNTIASSATGIRLNGSVTVSCVAGDYLEIYAFQDSGGALNIDGTIGSAFNYFSVERLSGPSAIAASETVAASYWLSANQAVTLAVTNVNFDTREFDTHGAVTTGASWAFTAPISGTYCFALTVETNSVTSFYANKNGTFYKYIATNPVANVTGGGSALIRLNAGDVINIRTNATVTVRGQALLTGLPSQIHIHRIGN